MDLKAGQASPTVLAPALLLSNQLGGPEFLDPDVSRLRGLVRLLDDAADPQNPLLARVNSIVLLASRLDQFFLQHVAPTKRQLASASCVDTERNALAARLIAIRAATLQLIGGQADCFNSLLRPALAAQQIQLLDWENLDRADQDWAQTWFQEHVFPLLTPLVVDPTHPSPNGSSLSTAWAIALENPQSSGKLLARVTIPAVLPQWVALPAGPGEQRFVRLLDVVNQHLDAVFPGMRISSALAFRMTPENDPRAPSAGGTSAGKSAADVNGATGVRATVRLEHGPVSDPWLLQTLLNSLKLAPEDAYEVLAELDFGTLRTIVALNLPVHQHAPLIPVTPGPFVAHREDVFSVIRRGDVLVHHPYESFTESVERFVQTAVHDPRVVALRMTLSRIGDENPFVPLLIRASEAGKQVVCLIEETPRDEDRRSQHWAQALEKAGVFLACRNGEMPTHAKVILVVRQESPAMRCYAHIGTGNYHPATARQSTDFGLFTCRPDYTRDLVALFHSLSAGTFPGGFRKLSIAPLGLREHYVHRIERETAHKRNGRKTRIIAQLNHLEDRDICRALYRASAAGVRIDLIVGGTCCLNPGVPGLSENIRVLSIGGRFQEHARICFFRNGAEDPVDGEFSIGSADWTPACFDDRIEVCTPIEDRLLRADCLEILQLMLEDHRGTWNRATGTSLMPSPLDSTDVGVQNELVRITRQRASCFEMRALSEREPRDTDFDIVLPPPVRTPWMLKGPNSRLTSALNRLQQPPLL